MYCPRCLSQTEDNSLFCSKCGYDFSNGTIMQKADEDMDITMVIPAVKEREESKAEIQRPAIRPSYTKKSQTKIEVMTFLIAFLSTLLVGFAVIAIILIPRGINRNEEEKSPGYVHKSAEEKETQNKKEEIKLQEGKSEGREEKRGIYEESDFSFVLGKTVETKEFSAKTLNNTEFGYSCGVPSDFVFLYDRNSEIRYCAEDKTAYIDIGAFQNDADLTINEIKEMLSNQLGRTSDYEIDGDNWFTLRKKAGGVVHYFKCYVDSVVRYVEFAYPEQYAEMYEEYVRQIEPTFVKSN